MQVVLVPRHGHHLRYDGLLGPLGPELLHKFLRREKDNYKLSLLSREMTLHLQIVGCGLSDGEDMINQPSHAEAVQLLVEEVDPELASQERHVLYDGQSDPPLGVLRQLHYSGQQRLAQLLDADDLVDTVEVGDDVQPHVGALVLQLREEEWEEVLNGVVLAEDGRETHDDTGQGGLDVLVPVSDQLLDAGQQLSHDHLLLHALVQVQAEVLHLVSSGSSHFGLAVLQEGLEGGHQVSLGDVLPHGGLELRELVRHHVPHPPALVLRTQPQCRHH